MSFLGAEQPRTQHSEHEPTETAIGNADDCLYRAWGIFLDGKPHTDAERAVANDTLTSAKTNDRPVGLNRAEVSFVCKVAGCEAPCTYTFSKHSETGVVTVLDPIMPPLEVDCKFLDES